ncbi:MAG: PD40 domain-containing protein [Planctomycetales bacterium]|nr:PD40 domain-containing protein [Planctomycetales bacterium]
MSRVFMPFFLALAVFTIVHADESARPLFQIQIDGSDLKRIVPDESLSYGSPCFSPDGKRIAFDAWPGSQFNQSHVYVMDIAAGPDADLLDLGRGAMPSFSPVGKQVVVHMYDSNPNVVIVNANEKAERNPIGISTNGPRWSPNGKWIAFLNFQDRGGYAIYNIEDKTIKGLTSGIYQACRGGAWSPDGTKLAYPIYSPDGQSVTQIVLATIDENGTLDSERVLTGMKNISANLTWSPDSKMILYSGQESDGKSYQLYTIPTKRNSKPVKLPGQDPNQDNIDPTWSPDGKTIVFCAE